MTKTRIQFAKEGALRFIGHLDFLRVFGQMLRRTGLPLAYSQGFNPHIQLGFALPLPLGMASINDYADLTFAQPIDLIKAAAQMQAHAPQGLTVRRIWEQEGRAAAAITTAADYVFTGTITTDLLSKPKYIIAKKTKSGIKDTDIRPDIFAIYNEGTQITMKLAAGSGRFLNPLTVAQIITGREVTAGEVKRLELYEQVGEGFAALGGGRG
ncbi:MAG: TIGR03936 family radical SAM-associated protein [Defluviitaleaceae bacterium]|nr:TIGR03936 family radical SAM-associated protein [Defluviitaleaceae bacterium]